MRLDLLVNLLFLGVLSCCVKQPNVDPAPAPPPVDVIPEDKPLGILRGANVTAVQVVPKYAPENAVAFKLSYNNVLYGMFTLSEIVYLPVIPENEKGRVEIYFLDSVGDPIVQKTYLIPFED